MFGLSLLFTVILGLALIAATIAMIVIGKKREWLTQLTIGSVVALDLVIVFAFVAILG